MSIFTQLARMIHPPRIVAVTRRPAGWFAVGRRGLSDVVAWAITTDDVVVGLVAGRRGLVPAVGHAWRGFLPASPHGQADVRPTPPPISVPVPDLVAAIGDANPWEPAAQAAIYARLRLAAMDEWARPAFAAYIADPTTFVKRYMEMYVEHQHVAELDHEARAFFDALIPDHDMRTRAESGREKEHTSS
jgi:hypothetical protein